MKRATYLILGGSSGMGLATAIKLATAGYRVVLVSEAEEQLKDAVQQLTGEGHLIYKYDLNDIDHIENIFAFLATHDIKLNGMVYCAGVSPLCLLADNRPELMEKVFHINCFSLIECAKYFYKEEYSYEGGKIVALTSTAAHLSGYRQTLYGASKAALIAAVKLMSKELLNRGIKINCISPGATNTPMLDDLRVNAVNMEEKIRLSQPLGVIPPEKIADVICMLLSPIADYLTGTEILYDAGSLLK